MNVFHEWWRSYHKPCINNVWTSLLVILKRKWSLSILIVLKIKSFVTSTIVRYCLSLINHLSFGNPQVNLDNLTINVYILSRQGNLKQSKWMGVPKNAKTKNAIFSLNRRCFPAINNNTINKTPICFQLFTGMMIWCFFYIYFHNEKKLLRFSDGLAGFWAKMIPRKLTHVPPTILIQSFVSQEGTCRCQPS